MADLLVFKSQEELSLSPSLNRVYLFAGHVDEKMVRCSRACTTSACTGVSAALSLQATDLKLSRLAWETPACPDESRSRPAQRHFFSRALFVCST